MFCESQMLVSTLPQAPQLQWATINIGQCLLPFSHNGLLGLCCIFFYFACG
jgi:hypothetical protein